MALEGILNKIDENASLKSGEVVAKAESQAKEIIEDAKEKAEQLRQKMIKQEAVRIDEVSQRNIVSARLKSKSELLEQKRRIVDLCFDKALEGLAGLDDGVYRRLIANMLGGVNFPGKAEIIFSNNDKQRISPEFIGKINPELTLGFSDELRAGFIIKGKDVWLDNSFEKDMESMRQDWESAAAKILFGS